MSEGGGAPSAPLRPPPPSSQDLPAHTVVAGEGGACSLPEVGGGVRNRLDHRAVWPALVRPPQLLSLSHTHTHTHAKHTHSLTLTLTLSLSHTHTNTHIQTHTHTHTHRSRRTCLQSGGRSGNRRIGTSTTPRAFSFARSSRAPSTPRSRSPMPLRYS